jgi:hypothetical protein
MPLQSSPHRQGHHVAGLARKYPAGCVLCSMFVQCSTAVHSTAMQVAAACGSSAGSEHHCLAQATGVNRALHESLHLHCMIRQLCDDARHCVVSVFRHGAGRRTAGRSAGATTRVCKQHGTAGQLTKGRGACADCWLLLSWLLACTECTTVSRLVQQLVVHNSHSVICVNRMLCLNVQRTWLQRSRNLCKPQRLQG